MLRSGSAERREGVEGRNLPAATSASAVHEELARSWHSEEGAVTLVMVRPEMRRAAPMPAIPPPPSRRALRSAAQGLPA